MRYIEVKDFNYDDCFKFWCLIAKNMINIKNLLRLEFI